MATKAKRAKPRTMFMHTINGFPATFDGETIHLAGVGPFARRGIQLVATLKEIKAQRNASVAWRKQHNFRVGSTYGWALVELPS